MPSRTRLLNKDNYTKLDQIMKGYCQVCTNKGFNFIASVVRAKARSEASTLKIPNFKASRSWLQKFTNRNNLTYVKISGESKPVDDQIVAAYIPYLPEKLCNYKTDEISNSDETGLFYKGQSSNSYSFDTADRHGAKNLKNHIAMLLCVSLSCIKR